MTGPSPTDAFARAAAALVREHDAADVLAILVSDARESLDAAAIGVLVRSGHGGLEVLTTTSHGVAELELLQAQEHGGPCLDAVATGAAVAADGPATMASRWPAVGPGITAAGFGAVRAFPMRWHDQVLGAVNVFLATPPADECSFTQLAQAFTDIATLVILSTQTMSNEQIVVRTEEALAGRAVIEQAKGVLVYVERLPVDTAYDRLRAFALQHRLSLTAAARAVVHEASGRPDPAGR